MYNVKMAGKFGTV